MPDKDPELVIPSYIVKFMNGENCEYYLVHILERIIKMQVSNTFRSHIFHKYHMKPHAEIK